MIVTAIQFWQKLESAGLFSSEQCRQFLADMSETLRPDQMLEANQVANWMLQQKLLTLYQAKVLLEQREGPLNCGTYTVQAEINDPAINHWYRAAHESGAGEFWLYALPDSLLQQPQLQANPPSVHLARAHAEIDTPMLCQLTVPHFSDGYLCVASSIAEGRSLLSTMQGVAMPPATARQIIVQVAMALDQLHQVGLVHGDIGLHSVWWDGDQSVHLIRDSLFWPQNPLVDTDRYSTFQADPTNRLRYAAPEFTVPGQTPTVATDLYAMGCLWYELLTGKPLIEASDPTSIAKVALGTLNLSSIKIDGFSQPMQKILAHLLAKNPLTRFASALQFLTALQVATAPTTANSSDSTSVKQSPEKLKPRPAAIAGTNGKRQAWAVESRNSATTSTVSPQKPAAAPSAPQQKTVTPVKSPSVAKPVASAPVGTPAAASTVAHAAAQRTERISLEDPAGARETMPVQASNKAKPELTKGANAAAQVTTRPIQQEPSKSPETKRLGDAIATAVRTESVAKAMPPVDQAPKQVQASTPQQSAAKKQPAQPVVVEKVETINEPTPETVHDDDPFGFSQISKTTAAPRTTRATKADDGFDLGESLNAPKPSEGSGQTGSLVRKRSKKQPVWFLPAIIGGALLLVCLLAYALTSGTTTDTKPSTIKKEGPAQESTSTATTSTETPISVQQDNSQPFELITDDQVALWAPPHKGDPIPLDLLPAGLQGIVHLNVEQIASKTEYAQIDAVMNTTYRPLQSVIQRYLPLPLDQWKSITIGLYPNAQSQWPDMVFRGELRQPTSAAELWSKYPFSSTAETQSIAGKSLMKNGDATISVFALTDQEGANTSTVVAGPSAKILEIIDLELAMSPLTANLQKLVEQSNANNDMTCIATCSLLVSSAPGPLQENAPVLLSDLKLRRDITAISVSTDIGENWYGELRLTGVTTQIAPKVKNELRTIVDRLPENAESYSLTQASNPYWNKVALRLGQQTRAMVENLRIAVESSNTVANFYLPKKAAPNLMFAGWMSLRTEAPVVASQVASNNDSEHPLGMDELLKLPITIRFEQESLESGAREIESAVRDKLETPESPIKISLNGGALEKDGITRNQQIRNFAYENIPLREVLISLVRKGNPVTTVQNANEKDQKLVWVVKDPDQRTIEITTRTDATTNNKTLPHEFVAGQ